MLERHLDLWKIIVRHIMYMWLFHHNYLQSHHLGHKVVQVELDWEGFVHNTGVEAHSCRH